MGKIATRRTILGAALQLFTTRGFHDTSTALIAREAGVATGTLFHHFASKAELVDALQHLIAGHRRRLLAEAADPTAPVADQIGALLRADVR
jgi:AcrR family transcriptional regulator